MLERATTLRVAAVAIPLLFAVSYSVISGGLLSEWHSWRANLAFLRSTHAAAPAAAARYLDQAYQQLAEGRTGAATGKYRYIQISLSPSRGCAQEPRLAAQSNIPAFRAKLDDLQVAELSRWIDEYSVVARCLDSSPNRAAAYYDWVDSNFPDVSANLRQTPLALAGSFVRRSYARSEAGDSAGAQADWAAASSYAPQREAFFDLADRLAAGHLAAEQLLLAHSVANGDQPELARIYLAKAYNDSGNARSAFEAAMPLVDALSGDTRAWQQYGQALIGLRRLGEAREALEEAVRLAPRDAQALNRLGVLYLGMGELSRADEVFRSALATQDGMKAYWIWEHLGDTLQKEGRSREAADAYRRAIAVAPPAQQDSARSKLAALGD